MLGLVLAVPFVAGCEDPVYMSEGYVTSKKYEPPWVEITPSTSCIIYKSDFTCAMYSTTYNTTNHEEEYSFQLEDKNAEDKRLRKGWINVDKQTYHEYAVGMHYPDAR